MIPILVGVGIVIFTVLIHHETLYLLYHRLQQPYFHPRFRLMLGVIGALMAHFIEILVFAVGYHSLMLVDRYGTLVSPFFEGFNDIVYFSFVTYSSLGYGDIRPEGPIRFIAGMEVLAGMVMIAWTASFLFGLIRNAWKKED